MIPNPTTIKVPLYTDEHGAIYVSGTRITLDTIVARYQQGSSAENIHEGFDILPLNDIYAVISYYLANREQMDDYLKHREDEARCIQKEVEAAYTPDQRERNKRLLQHIDEKHNNQDS